MLKKIKPDDMLCSKSVDRLGMYGDITRRYAGKYFLKKVYFPTNYIEVSTT